MQGMPQQGAVPEEKDMTTTLVERARRYATKAHAAIDQRRKYTNDPYIVHPQAVMEIVSSVPHSEEMLAAAWLHDTVEDTPTTPRRYREPFWAKGGRTGGNADQRQRHRRR